MNIWSLHRSVSNLTPLPPMIVPKISPDYPIPVYEMSAEREIVDVWNESAREQNARIFRDALGRDPVSISELDQWVAREVAGA